MNAQTTTLIIRNMVCDRCKQAVVRILDEVGLTWQQVELGEVQLREPLSSENKDALSRKLEQHGFALVEDRDAQLIAKVKAAIVKEVHYGKGDRVELTKLVQDAVHREFSSVSKLFSEVEGITIEHYYLLQRLERVKELIRYGELTFSEIAFQTGFSSSAHLSNQFKKLTGMTPSAFRNAHGRRTALDRV